MIEVIKGDDVKGDTVTINFHAIPTGLLGPWSVYYYPGEMVWTHLVGKDGHYTSTWWNARGTRGQQGGDRHAADHARRDGRIPKRGP